MISFLCYNFEESAFDFKLLVELVNWSDCYDDMSAFVLNVRIECLVFVKFALFGLRNKSLALIFNFHCLKLSRKCKNLALKSDKNG